MGQKPIKQTSFYPVEIEPLNIYDIYLILKRGRYFIFLTLICTFVGLYYSVLKQPSYLAKSSVLYQNSDNIRNINKYQYETLSRMATSRVFAVKLQKRFFPYRTPSEVQQYMKVDDDRSGRQVMVLQFECRDERTAKKVMQEWLVGFIELYKSSLIPTNADMDNFPFKGSNKVLKELTVIQNEIITLKQDQDLTSKFIIGNQDYLDRVDQNLIWIDTTLDRNIIEQKINSLKAEIAENKIRIINRQLAFNQLVAKVLRENTLIVLENPYVVRKPVKRVVSSTLFFALIAGCAFVYFLYNWDKSRENSKLLAEERRLAEEVQKQEDKRIEAMYKIPFKKERKKCLKKRR